MEVRKTCKRQSQQAEEKAKVETLETNALNNDDMLATMQWQSKHFG